MFTLILYIVVGVFGFFSGAAIMGAMAADQYQKGYNDRKEEERYLKYK